MNRVIVLNRVLAGLLLATLLVNWRLLPPLYSGPPTGALVPITLIQLSLLGVAVAGLLRFRQWGYFAVYALVPVSTVLLSISLVPFVVEALPMVLRPAGLTFVNGAVVLLTAVAHAAYRRARSGIAAPSLSNP